MRSLTPPLDPGGDEDDMKQVLVIPEDKEAEFWGDTEDMLSVDFYKKYSPGNLLAEFEGKIMRDEDGDYVVPFKDHIINVADSSKPVHILILEEK